MNPLAPPVRVKYAPPPYETNEEALAKARALWGEAGFADACNHSRLGPRCRVGIMSGTTRVIFANAGTWGEAFRLGSEGAKSYATIQIATARVRS